MRSVTRSLTTALIVAAVMLVSPAFNRGTLNSQSAPASRSNMCFSRVSTTGLKTFARSPNF